MGCGASNGGSGSVFAPGPASPSGGCGLTAVPVESPVWSQLCELLRVLDPHNLGVGRDVKESDVYNDLKPVAAWKIFVSNRHVVYDAAKAMVRDDQKTVSSFMELPKVKTKLDATGGNLGRLDHAVNEKYLLHGTKPENLVTIMRNGLNEKFSGGLLGDGLYLAEDPSKADQYCTADHDGGAGLSGLHERLYDNLDLEHPGKVYYMLVCKVALGIPIYTKDGETNMFPPENAAFVDDSKRELAVIPDSEDLPVHYHTLVAEKGRGSDGYILERHREFVVFHSNRVVEEYLVAYKRWMNAEVEGPGRASDRDKHISRERSGKAQRRKTKRAPVKVSCHPHPLTKFYNPSADWCCDEPCQNCSRESDTSERWSCRECDFDLCKSCLEHWREKEKPFAVGDIVEVRDGPSESWYRGRVTGTDPLEVMPESPEFDGETYTWQEIRRTHVWSEGDWAMARDNEEEDWVLTIVTSASPLRVRVPEWDDEEGGGEEYEYAILRPPFNLPRVTPLNCAVGAVVMRNQDWDAAWGEEDIHPPKKGSGVVAGFTDYRKAPHGDIGTGGEGPALASVLWDGDTEPREYRIGFADEHWLGLLSGGAKEPEADECYCVLSDAQELMKAFERFRDDDVNGWTAAKQARCGQPGKVVEVYDDFTVNMCFFSDDEEMYLPYEALDPKISEGDQLTVQADFVKLAGAFGRFPEDETNGWSNAKQDRCGLAGEVVTVYDDATVTLRFSDGQEMDFPFEALLPSA